MTFRERVLAAHGDGWQAEGRLRAESGGGVAEVAGMRLMASGLPYAKWNNGDVHDAGTADVEAARRWYAESGVPWGVRVPGGTTWAHGRLVLRKRCMGLEPPAFLPAALPSGVAIRPATTDDLDAAAAIDAAAFGDEAATSAAWLTPQIGAAGFSVVLAEVGGEPAGVALGVVADGWAGRSVGITGVGVLEGFRRRGIGAALVSWLVERGLAAGATLARLEPDDDAAARLYGRLGFVEVEGLDVYVEL